MLLHVVEPGDSLWKIARKYDVTLQQLIKVNKLLNPEMLAVGQTILVPKDKYHTVQAGESLWQIGRSYGIQINEIVQANNIQNPDVILIGQQLYIPEPKSTVEISAYLDPRMTGDRSVGLVNEAGEYLTYLAIFTYAVNRDGTLTPVNDDFSIKAALDDRVVPVMVLANFEQGTFSTDLATAVLTSEYLQDRILTEALQIMADKGYKVLDFDFEYLGRKNRERYNNFLRKAARLAHKKGYLITAALAPKLNDDQTGILYEGHDYASVGEIVDIVFFMTYEWGWSGGPPMAVSPLNQVRKVMDYAIAVVPKSKVMMGIPHYGYDWTLPYVKGESWARSITPEQAVQLAIRYNVNIQYDLMAQAPYFYYRDDQGKNHEVWFEDARSIQAKFDLVKELGIRGFFYWVLRGGFAQNWALIKDNFVVRKKL